MSPIIRLRTTPRIKGLFGERQEEVNRDDDQTKTYQQRRRRDWSPISHHRLRSERYGCFRSPLGRCYWGSRSRTNQALESACAIPDKMGKWRQPAQFTVAGLEVCRTSHWAGSNLGPFIFPHRIFLTNPTLGSNFPIAEVTHMAKKLGFENKETICTEEARTVRELIDHLEAFCKRVETDTDLVYIENGETNNVTIRLVQNTLTDGSNTYDVRVSL